MGRQTKPIPLTDKLKEKVLIGMAVSAISALRQEVVLYGLTVKLAMSREKRKRMKPDEIGLLTGVKEQETKLAETMLAGLTHSQKREVQRLVKEKIANGSL